jgi:hypothetical protein
MTETRRAGDADGHTNPAPGEAGGSQSVDTKAPRGHSEGPDASLSDSDAAEASLGVSRDDDESGSDQGRR